jgi:hypothetical protein
MFHLFRKPQRERREDVLRFAPDVSVRVHEGGAVFLHTAKGVVYSCNAVGAKVWTGLRDGRALEEIASRLATEYGVSADTVAQDADRFIGELERAGIVARAHA